MEKLIEYIENQFIRAQQRLKLYTSKDTWVYPKRQIVYKTKFIWESFLRGKADPRVVIIPGIRGVGKTTALAQTYFELKERLGPKYDPRYVLYISLEEVVETFGCTLNDVLTAYEKVIGRNFEALDQNVFLFFDEIQYDPNWSITLKVLRDRSTKVLVFCSGSSAVALNTNPDLARRAVTERLFPTSFPEYVMIENNVFPVLNLKDKIRTAIFNSRSADEVYSKLKPLEDVISQYYAKFDVPKAINNYLRVGTLPFAAALKNEHEAFDRIAEILNRVVKDDIPKVENFKTENIPLLTRLLFILSDCSNLSLEGLSRAVNTSIPQIQKMLGAFEKSEILIRLRPYGSKELQTKLPSKYLFMSPAFRASFYDILAKPETYKTKLGNLFEDVIGMYLYRMSLVKPSERMLLFYDQNKDGADFIVNNLTLPGNIVFEVGLGNKKSNQVANTMKRAKALYGACISSAPLSLNEDLNIVKIPLRFFFLL